MLGQKISISKYLLFLGMAAAPLAAANADYFPLQVGNQWIYQSTSRFFSGPAHVVSITGTKTFGSTSYFVLEGLGAETLYLRSDEKQGIVYAYNADTGGEAMYANFNTEVGDSFQTVADPCTARGIVRSRDAKVTTPVGEFMGVFQVEYPAANCADAGLAADFYAPYVGLLKRDSITIAGPRAMELVYARVGGVTVLSSPEVSFGMALDKAVYDTNGIPMMNVRMTLRSTLPQPVDLVFPSSQRFDFMIRDARGATVYTWSADKQFAQVFGSEKFGPGERNYTLQVPLQDGQNQRLAPGKYIAEGYLATQGEQPSYVARVGFEIIPEAEPAKQ